MVLHDVADGAGLFVKSPAPLDAKILGHRDLNAVDEIAVPDRFQKRIGKPEEQQVLHRLLAQKVVDPEDGFLVEIGQQDAIELDADSRSRPNGFSTMTRAALAQPDLPNCSTTTGNICGGMAR